MRARHAAERCLQRARGKGSETRLPRRAGLHKALHLRQVCRRSSPLRLLLVETQQRLKVLTKKPGREGFQAVGSQKAPTLVTASVTLLLVPGKIIPYISYLYNQKPFQDYNCSTCSSGSVRERQTKSLACSSTTEGRTNSSSSAS